MYAKLGVSDHSPEVKEAQELLEEAQRRSGVITPKLVGPLAAAGTPSTASVTASGALARGVSHPLLPLRREQPR